MIRLCGHLLLWTGFFVGAFVSVRRAEVSEDPWSTIPWPTYLSALGVAVAGVIVLRVTRRPRTSDAETSAGAIEELVSILDRVHTVLQDWSASSDEIPVYDVHSMIDQELAEELGRFAELREVLIAEFGLDCYAQIMTEFALAERTINRTWSASADGYVDEVRTCLVRAVQHVAAARQRLGRAIQEQNSAPGSGHAKSGALNRT